MNNVIQVFRSLLVSITGTVYRIFSAKGLADQTLAGKMYQHFGFRSTPPVDTELATIKFGNNIISVAENDGVGATAPPQPLSGETTIYSSDGDYIYLRNDPSVSNTLVLNSKKNMEFDVGDTLNPGTLEIRTGKVQIGKIPVSLGPQALVQKAYSDALTLWINTYLVSSVNAAMAAAGVPNPTPNINPLISFTPPVTSTTLALESD
jgi:hypothetical protein